VSSGSKKRNCLIVGYVGYDPILSISRVSGDVNRTSAQRTDEITLYMTFGKAFQIAMKFVFPASFRQGFIPNKKHHNIKNFVQILLAFFHQFEVFFELVCEGKLSTV
jgi:hypothetical protein